jgi:hypothetical protein
MLKYRKQMLLAVMGLLLLGYGGDWLWSTLTEPIQSLRQKQQTLRKDIDRRQLEVAKARQAAKTLAAWSQESLPADPQVARSLYQAWLLELVNRLGLTGPSVDSTQPSERNGYVSMTFSLQARGTLDQWTRFLYEFYRSGQLHQLRSVAFTPISKHDQLDMVFSIEALVLPGANSEERLSDAVSDRLAFERLQDYQPVVRRNLFGASGAADPTDQTLLTGIHSVNGVPEAWFTLRHETDPERAVAKLRLGQTLVIGEFQAKLLEIAEQDVTLEADGERWLVAIGESLTQAFALPPEY